MKTCVVLPLHTELGEIREKIVLLPGMGGRVLSLGDAVPVCDRLVIDLTLDWFRPLVNPPWLLTLLADVYGYFAHPGVEKIVFRGYGLETNQVVLAQTLGVFGTFLGLMKKMFSVKEVGLPTLISRKGLLMSKHPLLQCLLAMRSGTAERIPWSAQSELYVAYEMDMLSWLGDYLNAPVAKGGTLVGERYTLGEIVGRTEPIFSSSAITFDSRRCLSYREEGPFLEGQFAYGIENIAMELL